MVHVAVTRDAQEILELDVCGHAGQAPHGEDLVCAGVSSIMVGMLNAIDQLANETCELSMAEGHIHIRSKEGDARAQLLLAATLISLQPLEESYSGYIQITVQEV